MIEVKFLYILHNQPYILHYVHFKRFWHGCLALCVRVSFIDDLAVSQGHCWLQKSAAFTKLLMIQETLSSKCN